MQQDMSLQKMREFRLPRPAEIPDVGLYLEQVARYLEQCLAPLPGMELTGSMISNYVKKKLVDNPIKKLYYRPQLMQLLFIAVAKTVLSMEEIQLLLTLQRSGYDQTEAYVFFCRTFEQVLAVRFGGAADPALPAPEEEAAQLLKDVLQAAADRVYLDQCFARLKAEQQ